MFVRSRLVESRACTGNDNAVPFADDIVLLVGVGRSGTGMKTKSDREARGVDRRPAVALDSVALARLVEEVRVGTATATEAYNRMHNRHNR